jgi:hypothetical protein
MLCNRFDGRTGNAGVVGRAAPRQFSVEEVLRFEFAGFLKFFHLRGSRRYDRLVHQIELRFSLGTPL